MFSLEGKVAVVTGGASGIGLATARRFAKAGAKVAIADITDASAIAKEVGGLFVKTDVSKEEQVKTLMDKAAENYGRIDRVGYMANSV
jgi:NAD(P)-dependent dehydrogenase (short-subunit alcohol dehydrogenase family)